MKREFTNYFLFKKCGKFFYGKSFEYFLLVIENLQAI